MSCCLCCCPFRPVGDLMVAFDQPPVLRSPALLTFDVTTLHSSTGGPWLTRGFNGNVPGPTIRTAPGQQLQVTLRNLLGGSLDSVHVASNLFHLDNATSLHSA